MIFASQDMCGYRSDRQTHPKPDEVWALSFPTRLHLGLATGLTDAYIPRLVVGWNMRLPLGLPAPKPIRLDPEFWLRDLRCGRYATVMRAVRSPVDLRAEVARAFPTRRHAVYVADRLGVPTLGRLEELHRELCRLGEATAPYLLAASYASNKPVVALADAVATVLGSARVDRCLDSQGRPDRLLLAFALLDEHPEALPTVRALVAWQRLPPEVLVLADAVPAPRRPMSEFLTEENVNEAVRGVPLPRNVPPLRFDLRASPPGGGDVVIIRRNAGRAAVWDDDAENLLHGHDEANVVLHFMDQGRRVRVSTPRLRLSRLVAEAISSAWYGCEVRYEVNETPVDDRTTRMFVQSVVGRHLTGLRLLGIGVRQAPLDGAPMLTLSTDGALDLQPSIVHFEAVVGPLLERLDLIDHLVVDWSGRPIRLVFQSCPGGVRLQLATNGPGHREIEAFQREVRTRFGFELGSEDVA